MTRHLDRLAQLLAASAAMAFLSAAPLRQNKCSGSAESFGTNFQCTDNDCGDAAQDDCEEIDDPNGDDETGEFWWCPCGDETDPPSCCIFIVRDEWGPLNKPDVKGKCEDCEPARTGKCKLEWSSGTAKAACSTPM